MIKPAKPTEVILEVFEDQNAFGNIGGRIILPKGNDPAKEMRHYKVFVKGPKNSGDFDEGDHVMVAWGDCMEAFDYTTDDGVMHRLTVCDHKSIALVFEP